MNSPIHDIIRRWRTRRNRRMLQSPYSAAYAFVGVGSHALQNLYPVLQYLGIRLKYICCKSPDKLSLIERRFGATATTALDEILNDNEVQGIFVCTSPQSHYEICIRIMASGKYIFVEKPPCQTLGQLKRLIETDTEQKTMVGMQKRYSPLVRTLKSRLQKTESTSYTISYRTGAYPENDPLTNLFIHPVDLAIHLFGNAEIKDFHRTDRNGKTTIQVLLSHNRVKGFMELSTAYSWNRPEESVQINTLTGEYRLEQMEKLCCYPHPRILLGVPFEKVCQSMPAEQTLEARNNFSPLVANNQLYSQGFLTEIKAFADMVEHSGTNFSPFSSMSETYRFLTQIR